MFSILAFYIPFRSQTTQVQLLNLLMYGRRQRVESWTRTIRLISSDDLTQETKIVNNGIVSV